MPVLSQSPLKDPSTPPTPTVLKAILKTRYAVLEELLSRLVPSLEINHEWRFTRDGHAWVCRLHRGKKTIAWLSVWEGGAKLAFYFNAKNAHTVNHLAISEKLKAELRTAKPIGQLRPLVIVLQRKTQLKDVSVLLTHKAALK